MNHTPEENHALLQDAVLKIYELEKELALLKIQLGVVRKDQDYLSSGIGRVLWLIGGGAVTALTAWFVARGINH